MDESRDEDLIDITTSTKDALEHDTVELVANQISDKLTISFNNNRKRFGIRKGIPIAKPMRNYDNFKLADDGGISYVYKRTVIDLGNISERLKSPWEIERLGVAELKSMGFINITGEVLIYLLGGRLSFPPPPKKKVFAEKNLQLFQIKIFLTMILKGNSTQKIS